MSGPAESIVTTATHSLRSGGLVRVTLLGILVGGLLASAVEAYSTVVGKNVHEVVSGRLYRCAQPDGVELARLVELYGIRTVINLRGPCLGFEFFEEEGRATQALDLDQEDVRMSACRLPSVHEIRRLVEIFDRTRYPVLVHCRRGSDRTGLVSMLYLLLHTEQTPAEAARQLALRYGHIAVGRTAQLDRFFEFYTSWLRDKGSVHTSEQFRHWLLEKYCPGEYRCDIEPVEVPTALPLNRPSAVRLRFVNTSDTTWQMRPGATTGIHAVYLLAAPDGTLVSVQKAGLFDAQVAPGEGIDLTLALPSVHQAGIYRLIVDLADEQHCWFVQAGSEPFETELRFQ